MESTRSRSALRRLPAARGLFAALALLGLVLAAVSPAYAARVPPAATFIVLQEPTASVLGSNVDVVASLTDAAGHPLADMHVTLQVNGTQVTSGRTDPNGRILFTVRTKDIPKAATYTLQATFTGTSAYVESTTKAELKVLPAAVQVRTVPPVPGLTVTLGTASSVTGPDGIAAFPVPAPGTMQLSADLNIQGPAAASMRASFVRWLDEIYTPNRTVDIKGPDTFVMGLTVAYRASVAYVGLDNQPVNSRLVEQARFSAGTGTQDVVINGQIGAGNVWWTAASAVRRGGDLVISPVTYRLLSVKIGGAEVVNRGQQAWTPTQNGVWTVQLLLYGMTVQTSDALFGSPVTGKLDLVYPNGDIRTADVAGDGQVTFNNLPRGQYQLKLHASAVTPPTSVALSRAQTANLRVITYVDIAVFAAVVLLLLLVLVIVGRRHLAMRTARWIVAAPRALAARVRRRREGDTADTPAT